MDAYPKSLVERTGPVVRLFGEVDVANSGFLSERLRSMSKRGEAVVVDMTEVTFIDSTCLAALIVAQNQFRDDGCSMRLVITHPNVLKVFEITALCTAFSIYPSVAAAAA